MKKEIDNGDVYYYQQRYAIWLKRQTEDLRKYADGIYDKNVQKAYISRLRGIFMVTQDALEVMDGWKEEEEK